MTAARKDIRNAVDLASLPKWAQGQIGGLLKQNEDLLRAQKVGPEDSDTFAHPYLQDWRKPLGKGTTIRFGGLDFDNTFDVQYSDGELDVVINAEGTEPVVLPRSSNRIILAFR